MRSSVCMYTVGCVFGVLVLCTNTQSSHAARPKKPQFGMIGLLGRMPTRVSMNFRVVKGPKKMGKALRKSLGRTLGKILSLYTKTMRAKTPKKRRRKRGCLRLQVYAKKKRGWLRFRNTKHEVKYHAVRKETMFLLERQRHTVQKILRRFQPNKTSVEVFIGFSTNMFISGCFHSTRWGLGSRGWGVGGLKGARFGKSRGYGYYGSRKFGKSRGGGGGVARIGGFGRIGHRGRARVVGGRYGRHKRSLRTFRILSLRLKGHLDKRKARRRLRLFVRRTKRCLRGRLLTKTIAIRVFALIRKGQIMRWRLSTGRKNQSFNRYCLKRHVSKWWGGKTERGSLTARMIVPSSF